MNKKRILSVRLIRELDTDADTSYLGEYSNTAASEFAIDRAHSEDCASVVPINKQAQQMLINARGMVAELQKWEAPDTDEWESLEDAYNILDSLAEGMQDCDCDERGDMRRGQYRYFNPYVQWADSDSEQEKREIARSQYERMESLNAGDWCYIGIRAQAEVQLTSDLVQTITSGGLWGIESDSDESYLKEIESEQLAELKSQLRAIGFSTRAISKAFKSITEVE